MSANALPTDTASQSDCRSLPLFPDLRASSPLYREINAHNFNDPFLAALVASAPVQRLKGIGFLGAIDYVRHGNGLQHHRRRHNRYDHSIGVARLAQIYAQLRELPQNEARILIAAGILHDVGHGPLSHTLEPIFQNKFDISHHKVGASIVRGKTSLGNDVQEIMRRYQIDLEEVVAMIEGHHNGPHSYLFSSPINFDTIEGITRSSLFMARTAWKASGEELVRRIAKQDRLPTEAIDKFWALKHDVYNLFIHTQSGLVFDGLAQAYMLSNIDQFRETDFFLTEDQLRYKQPVMFHLFAWARTSRNRIYVRANQLNPALLRHEIRAPKRTFFVDREVELTSVDDLSRRYQQRKKSRHVTIEQLVKPCSDQD